MVNFDGTVNTLAFASYLVNQKDGERGLRERLRGIRIDFHLRQLSAGIPEYSNIKQGAATMSIKSNSRKDLFAILPTGFGKSLIFQLFPRLAKAAMKSEMRSIVVVSLLVSVMRDQVEQLKQLGFSAAPIGLGEEYEEDEKGREKGSVSLFPEIKNL